MKCPRCVQKIHRAAAVCPHCGFSLADADAEFGSRGVRMPCLADQAGLFRREEQLAIGDAMSRFQRAFPENFVAIFTGSPGERSDLFQFGFWLLNRAIFEDLPAGVNPDAGILLAIDPDARAAAVSFGYALDPFFREGDCFECLSRAHAYWLEGNHADGVLVWLDQIGKVLKTRCRQARRRPSRFPGTIKGDRARENAERRQK